MRGSFVAPLAIALIASSVSALPRETFNITNQGSNAPGDGGGIAPNLNHVYTGGYSPKYIVLSGNLIKVAAGTFGFEAIIQVNTPGGQHFVLNPVQVASFTGSSPVTNLIYRIPVDVPDAAGSWNFRFEETFDDAVGNDSLWNLTVTLDDGAPASKNLGVLTQKGRTRVFNEPHAAGQIHWYKLVIPVDINSGAGTFVDIDTLGTALTNTGTGLNDAEIGLYTADGALVANDDDDGGNRASQLTFGAGSRPAEGGLPYDGRDGALPAGTYFLAFGGFNSDFGATSWNVTSTSTSTGTVNIRIRTNVGEPNASNLGTINEPGKSLPAASITPGQVLWYTFDVPEDLTVGAGKYLDITTVGSSLPGSFGNQDTEIGLYTAAGNLVANDDDSGPNFTSQLSFGVGGRPAFGSGSPRNGQNGPLPAGRYFLAVSAFNTDFYTSNYTVSSNHTRTGSISLNFFTNGGTLACPADLDDGSGNNIPDGGVTVDDLIFFLRRFQNGC